MRPPPLHCLLVALTASAPAAATTIDRVVVVVADQLVLASDVRVEAELATLDTSPSPFWSADRATPEQRLVEAAIIRVVAADVSLYQPDDDAVRARVETVLQRVPERYGSREAFLVELALADASGLALVLRRRMVVERYLARSLQAGASWATAYAKLIAGLRERVRVRVIPERS